MRATWVAAIALLTMTLGGPAKADPGPSAAPSAPPVTQGTTALPSTNTAPVFSGPGPAQMPPDVMIQSLTRMHAQQQQLATQTRAQMLAALSPAHRTLVATLVGQLTVAPNPDQAAVARQLDATLSPSEQQAILRINAGARAESQALAEQTRALFESQMTPEQRAATQRQFAKMKADFNHLTPEQRSTLERQHAQGTTMPRPVGNLMLSPLLAQDAGSILLLTLTLPAGFFSQPNMSSGSSSFQVIHITPF